MTLLYSVATSPTVFRVLANTSCAHPFAPHPPPPHPTHTHTHTYIHTHTAPPPPFVSGSRQIENNYLALLPKQLFARSRDLKEMYIKKNPLDCQDHDLSLASCTCNLKLYQELPYFSKWRNMHLDLRCVFYYELVSDPSALGTGVPTKTRFHTP